MFASDTLRKCPVKDEPRAYIINTDPVRHPGHVNVRGHLQKDGQLWTTNDLLRKNTIHLVRLLRSKFEEIVTDVTKAPNLVQSFIWI